MSDNNTTTITLRSLDGEEFEVPKEVALMSVTIRNIIEDDWDGKNILLYNVESGVLAKVIEYCKRHSPATATTNNNEATTEEELEAWDKDFVMNMDKHELFEVIMATNYMVVQGLMNLTCRSVADMVKDLSVEEVRVFFNVENDFTEEEEAEIRRQNEWAFK
ncbi:SKP1-like protein 1A [Acorus gramineus]|uniref:SKP1-like protein n=1 Tax=Acorus gramineus TaxID=55184 RepID=A0AAV9BR30_ACOGR|nr:SKP1-like protein 1A [Acorus gramineus]